MRYSCPEILVLLDLTYRSQEYFLYFGFELKKFIKVCILDLNSKSLSRFYGNKNQNDAVEPYSHGFLQLTN